MMYGNADVFIYPSEIWSYVTSHKDVLKKNTVIIAEEIHTSGRIEVTVDAVDTGYCIAAWLDGKRMTQSGIIYSKDALIEECRDIYDFCFCEEEEQADDEEEADVDEVGYLLDTFADFVEVATGETNMDADEIGDVLLNVLSLLQDMGYSVLWPDDVELGEIDVTEEESEEESDEDQ